MRNALRSENLRPDGLETTADNSTLVALPKRIHNGYGTRSVPTTFVVSLTNHGDFCAFRP